jgi:hypothetical protein
MAIDRIEVYSDKTGWHWVALDTKRKSVGNASRPFDKRSSAVSDALAVNPDAMIMVESIKPVE